jgi:hypothetical protein
VRTGQLASRFSSKIINARKPRAGVAVKKIKCDCGKFIEYTDRVVGGSSAQSGTLVCSKCSKEHAITFLGFLSEIKNAALKR